MNGVPVIEVKGVYKSFKTVHAVRGIDLKINHGQFVALLGPNGAGKTTLVEMIEGIQKPDKGEILIMGKKWKGHEEEHRRLIGLSLQETYFIDKLNVRETLALFASFFKLNRTRVDEIISIVGLEEKVRSYTVNLSGGQRQRLALGIALINNPKILLLDEPTTGLDPNARQEIWAILFSLKEKLDTSLILTTHYMEEAERLCDFIIFIDNGKILKQGTREQLLETNEIKSKTIAFTIQNPVSDIQKIWNESRFQLVWDKENSKGTVLLDQLQDDLPEFLAFLDKANMKIKNLEIRRRTLDDVFISLTGRHLNE
jgi:ABC-2 type transport system ATP-binding protein